MTEFHSFRSSFYQATGSSSNKLAQKQKNSTPAEEIPFGPVKLEVDYDDLIGFDASKRPENEESLLVELKTKTKSENVQFPPVRKSKRTPKKKVMTDYDDLTTTSTRTHVKTEPTTPPKKRIIYVKRLSTYKANLQKSTQPVSNENADSKDVPDDQDEESSIVEPKTSDESSSEEMVKQEQKQEDLEANMPCHLDGNTKLNQRRKRTSAIANSQIDAKKTRIDDRQSSMKADDSQNAIINQSQETIDNARKGQKREKGVIHQIRYDGFEHWPTVFIETGRTKCKNEGCDQKTTTYCSKCQVHLCIKNGNNCFKKFHTFKQPHQN